MNAATKKQVQLAFGQPSVDETLRTVCRDMRTVDGRRYRGIASELEHFVAGLRALDVQLCCLHTSPPIQPGGPDRRLVPRWAGWTLLLCGAINVLKSAGTDLSNEQADRLGSIACDLCGMHDPEAELEFALWHTRGKLQGWSEDIAASVI
jgi:hypothetical protein